MTAIDGLCTIPIDWILKTSKRGESETDEKRSARLLIHETEDAGAAVAAIRMPRAAGTERRAADVGPVNERRRSGVNFCTRPNIAAKDGAAGRSDEAVRNLFAVEA